MTVPASLQSLRNATPAIALCDVKTLYLRNVPEEVTARLEVLAGREGMSVSSFAVRELGEIARRADNPALLGELPDLGVEVGDIVDEIEAGRSDR
jgi:plasmid stability protein